MLYLDSEVYLLKPRDYFTYQQV